ncbi:MAG: hypothetical protein ACOC9P_00835 [bacterium]
MRTHSITLLLTAAAVFAAGVWILRADAMSQAPLPGQTPSFDDTFWDHWGDGHAELAGYRLTFPRYGEQRTGSAVAIFVTETFTNELRVKADLGNHPESDTFPVMKLNLLEDFPTGIYDYNLMTSAFSALEPVNGYPAGTPTKVAFSSQEWCGLVHGQYLFNEDGIDYTLHSYFDGEADQRRELPTRERALVEDALLLWARGFAGSVLEPGESITTPMLKGLQRSRLQHEPPTWQETTFSRAADTEEVEVPAGAFTVNRYTAEIAGDRTWTILVEEEHPHRIIKWTTSDGQAAELTGAKRLKYWQMNANRFRETVEQLGLEVRTPGSM